uniref:Uncharacterized protein n=1 Tax=Arundo donax TaxID=35708 RepID=A0A0A9EGT1_ARUDO
MDEVKDPIESFKGSNKIFTERDNLDWEEGFQILATCPLLH